MTDAKDSGSSLSLIVARARNGVIGNNNELPWRLSDDLRYFKQVTMGKPILMGRKTYESIGRPLPGRTNIVVTRNQDWHAEGVSVVHSLTDALQVAEAEGSPEVMLIGGAELYLQAMDMAKRLYLTEVHAEPEGDAFFPAPDAAVWHEVKRDSHPADERNEFAFDFIVYERR